MRYLKSISNYLEIIILSNLTHIMSIVDLVTIWYEDTKNRYLEKAFTKLICINLRMISYLLIN